MQPILNRVLLFSVGASIVLSATSNSSVASDDGIFKAVAKTHCAKCHGSEEVHGEVNLVEVGDARQLFKHPELIEKLIKVIDANDMPPPGEPELDEKTRGSLLRSLKSLLRETTASDDAKRVPLRRLNRFQYNNSVKDLFQLNRNVFALSEKLMTRHRAYLSNAKGRMPDQVEVTSEAVKPVAGLQGVRAFPKDLRASHGFDNQANQLTLSPLLLDTFLRLGVSIVESPDFNDKNVGIWKEFFQPPEAGQERTAVVRTRLRKFLAVAFRRPVAETTLDRYTAYAEGKLETGLPFTETMKKVAAATLSSPMFFYRGVSEDAAEAQFNLASDLSYFLWASGPDQELIRLAAEKKLTRPRVLRQTIERMLADPKIERFLDTFPAQWMQLENILAATPDPQKYRLFSIDKNRPASLHMVLEPLLLFDAVFLENRPISELIVPSFSYQSDVLQSWYTSDLQPAPIDSKKITAENRRNDERRKMLRKRLASAQQEQRTLEKPLRTRLLAERKKDMQVDKSVDLKPYAAWEFNGDLNDSIGKLHLQPRGKVAYEDGMAVLNRTFLISGKLPFDLKAKSLEVWCKLKNLDQPGGGLMGIQGPGDFFDTIVIGERQARHWISGSNGFSRTLDFPSSTPEDSVNQMLHLVMVYEENGTTRLYRNGQPYGKPFRKGPAVFPKGRTSVILGLRHLPPGGNRFLNVSVDKARFYDRALTAEEVAASNAGHLYISGKQLLAAMSDEQLLAHERLTKVIQESQAELAQVPPPKDVGKLRQDARRAFEDDFRRKLGSRVFRRVEVDDRRYGGIITNAAMLSMTSGPKRTHPIARGAWIIEVIFNDPPPPPPNDVPALNEEDGDKDLTIREKFAEHRSNTKCAACHAQLDPLGFALENFDITGRWRDRYENGRNVDASGTLMRKYPFKGIVRFKDSIVKERRRFAKAFTAHLLRFALSRELRPQDTLVVEQIVDQTEQGAFKLQDLIRQVILSERFRSG